MATTITKYEIYGFILGQSFKKENNPRDSWDLQFCAGEWVGITPSPVDSVGETPPRLDGPKWRYINSISNFKIT